MYNVICSHVVIYTLSNYYDCHIINKPQRLDTPQTVWYIHWDQGNNVLMVLGKFLEYVWEKICLHYCYHKEFIFTQIKQEQKRIMIFRGERDPGAGSCSFLMIQLPVTHIVLLDTLLWRAVNHRHSCGYSSLFA